MTCTPYNIKVAEGNQFALVLPLKARTYTGGIPSDTDLDPTHLTDIVVKVDGVVYENTIAEGGVQIVFAGTEARGTYDVVLTAKYDGADIRAAYFQAVTIVAWNYQSDAEEHLPGSPIALQAAYIIGGALTDAELEELKRQYRAQIADAEAAEAAAVAAKEAFDQKAENLDNLDNVALQGSDPTATNTAILTAVQNITIDTSTLAQRTDVKDGNDTAVGVAKEIRSEVGTGSDTAAESGTLFAVLKWVKDKVKSIGTDYAKQGSNASANISDIQALIGYTISEIDGI